VQGGRVTVLDFKVLTNSCVDLLLFVAVGSSGAGGHLVEGNFVSP